MGELIGADLGAGDLGPANCNSGFFNGATVWTSSDPSVLQLRPGASLDHRKAVCSASWPRGRPGRRRRASRHPADRRDAPGQPSALDSPPCPTPDLLLVLEVVP